MRVTSLSSLLAAGLVLIGNASISAQTPAMICGTITDTTGGAMPGVAVTLTSTRDTAILPAKSTTDAKGDYLFPSVSVGTYTLMFELDGFKKTVRPNVLITSGFELRADQRMQVAAPVAEVSVAEQPATVAYDRRVAATGATFTKDILVNVPTRRTTSGFQPVRPCVASR